MHDEVLAGPAPLVGVVLAGEQEGVLDARAVDREGGVVGVLLDDREEVPEQAPLGFGQVGAGDRRAFLRVQHFVDGPALCAVRGRLRVGL